MGGSSKQLALTTTSAKWQIHRSNMTSGTPVFKNELFPPTITFAAFEATPTIYE